MIYARAHQHDYEAQPSRASLPELLGAEGVRLLIADSIVALILVAGSAVFNAARSGWLTVLTTLLCGALLGRYRRSFAATPRDEWYATGSVAVVAAVVLCVLVPLFEVSGAIAAAVLMIWSIGASAAASALTRHRRGNEAAVSTTNYLTAISRRRARNPVIRDTIAVIDFILAAALSIVLSPVYLLCAIALVSEREGPVLFLQHRIGVDGRDFRIFKFRTMKARAANAPPAESEGRFSKVGRFLRRTSLSGMPQLWNVLRGEMSLVGPRPDTSERADRLVRTVPLYEDRQAIRPGITGWSQIQNDRNAADTEFENVLRHDLFYVANYSVSLYLFCLVKTSFEVVFHRAL